MTKHGLPPLIRFGAILLLAAGCSKSEPINVRRVDAPDAAKAEATEAPIQPKLSLPADADPNLKFNSVDEEIAYWQDRAIAEVKKRFEKLTEADIQKNFDALTQQEQANIQRVRSWLPHKRIMEMGNPSQDVVTITSNPTQFDPDLALKRLLEYADDSGAAVLMKNLGIEKPLMMVTFRMEFGQIPPELQALVWGIHQKLREKGLAALETSEQDLVTARPGLFPRLR